MIGVSKYYTKEKSRIRQMENDEISEFHEKLAEQFDKERQEIVNIKKITSRERSKLINECHRKWYTSPDTKAKEKAIREKWAGELERIQEIINKVDEWRLQNSLYHPISFSAKGYNYRSGPFRTRYYRCINNIPLDKIKDLLMRPFLKSPKAGLIADLIYPASGLKGLFLGVVKLITSSYIPEGIFSRFVDDPTLKLWHDLLCYGFSYEPMLPVCDGIIVKAVFKIPKEFKDGLVKGLHVGKLLYYANPLSTTVREEIKTSTQENMLKVTFYYKLLPLYVQEMLKVYSGYYTEKISYYPSEKEVLVHPYSVFYVDLVTECTDGIEVKCVETLMKKQVVYRSWREDVKLTRNFLISVGMQAEAQKLGKADKLWTLDFKNKEDALELIKMNLKAVKVFVMISSAIAEEFLNALKELPKQSKVKGLCIVCTESEDEEKIKEMGEKLEIGNLAVAQRVEDVEKWISSFIISNNKINQ